MHFLLDLLVDVTVVYGVAAAASCAWFSYQWMTSPSDVRVTESYDGLTRQPGMPAPPPTPLSSDMPKVLAAAALAPLHATATVLKGALAPLCGLDERPRVRDLRPQTDAASVRERAAGMGMATIKRLFTQTAADVPK